MVEELHFEMVILGEWLSSVFAIVDSASVFVYHLGGDGGKHISFQYVVLQSSTFSISWIDSKSF